MKIEKIDKELQVRSQRELSGEKFYLVSNNAYQGVRLPGKVYLNALPAKDGYLFLNIDLLRILKEKNVLSIITMIGNSLSATQISDWEDRGELALNSSSVDTKVMLRIGGD